MLVDEAELPLVTTLFDLSASRVGTGRIPRAARKAAGCGAGRNLYHFFLR
ncbi:hypothetical protein KCP74_16385 [Salmonella enterica subsp. enterica]|nr:hypothetical protein KCP74_16385 [Salmonella enterica subsp. enterica]